MKYLTRKEELVLLTIFRMEADAYLVNIREQLNHTTDKKWTVGNVYVPLNRMTKLGFLDAFIGEPNAKRGGKAIKYYRLTQLGYNALLDIKKVNETMWQDFDTLIFEE